MVATPDPEPDFELPPSRPRLVNDNIEHKRQVVLLAFCFFFLFLGFGVAQSFQTSSDEHVGATTLFLVYFFFTLSCLIAPAVVSAYPPKRVLWVSSLAYVFFVLVNISPLPVLRFLAGSLCGVAAATLWTAQPFLLARLAESHEDKNGLPTSSALGSFNGIFFSIMSASAMFGNLLAGVLSSARVSLQLVFLVMTVIAGIGSSGLLLLAPLPPLPPSADDGKKKELPPPFVSRLLETLRMSCDSKMQRLVLVFVCMGAVKSFIYGTLPVLVSLAKLKFLLMASVGGFVALAAFVFGKLVKQFGEVRLFNFLFPAVFFASLSSALVLRGGPTPSLPFLFFVASLFGACDGGLSTVSNALVGRLFPERKEPAFAAMQLLTSATTAFFFAVHSNLPPQGKAAALCVLAVASLISVRLLVYLLDHQSANSKHYGSRKTVLRVEEL